VANIKLHQVVTKTVQKIKIQIPAGELQVFDEKGGQTCPEVKSYKTLEHINTMFEKKNNQFYPK
jgi:hypothetical protein